MEIFPSCLMKMTPTTCHLRPLLVSLMRFARRKIPLMECLDPLSGLKLGWALFLPLEGLENPFFLSASLAPKS